MPQRRRRAPSGDIERCAQLTLGENATLVVDDFVYDAFRLRGELSLRVVKGVLIPRGLVERLSGAKVQAQIPVAAIGVRGTTVWGGPIDNDYGVIVLSDRARRDRASWLAPSGAARLRRR
jgi:hypothetical protein